MAAAIRRRLVRPSHVLFYMDIQDKRVIARLFQVLRLVIAVLLVIVGGLLIGIALLWDRWRGVEPFRGRARQAQAAWSRWMCRLFGLRLEAIGELRESEPCLVVANHMSWLDIPVIAAFYPVAFLSKSEVRAWPVVGPIASGLGTLYIERGGRNAAAAAAEAIRQRLEEGQSVLLFPEGTTGDGSRLLPFRPRLYQAAIDAGVAVRPLALSYLTEDGARHPHAPHVEEPLPRHAWRLAGGPPVYARVQLGEPVRGEGRTELARRSREAIEVMLGSATGSDASELSLDEA